MAEECNHDCSGCTVECSSRKTDKSQFLAPMNAHSKIRRVIGVVSGKGGVGKSFVTAYLSVLFARQGFRCGILDADVTGPSIPKSFGIDTLASANDEGLLPAETRTGIRIMSLNLLLEDKETPVVWRGPVLAGTVKQFWSDVLWGDIDYLFVDMPPGTGDVPLTVYQSLPIDGVVIVSSPQELVSMIVGKAVNMAQQMEVPVLGLVENYSYVECGHCGEKLYVFGKSHIEETAAKYGVPVLAKLPLAETVAAHVDAGDVEGLSGEWLSEAAKQILAAMPLA